MDMTEYRDIISTHRRPYIYTVKHAAGGEAYIMGVAHTNDIESIDLDSVQIYWKNTDPTFALVEGRLGFLFSWFQDPVQKYGEGGLVSRLAKKKGIPLYSWEPSRDQQIELLMKEFSVEQIAMFYSLRPYFGMSRNRTVQEPEKKLQDLIDSRTDYEHIRGVYESWEDLDRQWKKDFPNLDWRTHSSSLGYWPDGYLFDIWNRTNLIRDEHLIRIIYEKVNEGERVFVTMGASHAPRIEQALKSLLEN